MSDASPPMSFMHARPRLITTFALGLAVALLLPSTLQPVTRSLIGWNLAVWLFLALMIVTMVRADHQRLRRLALAHAEGAVGVTAAVVLAVAASVAAIVSELSMARAEGHLVFSHLLFALLTLIGSWLLLPTLFAMSYASQYYKVDAQDRIHGGLQFPGPKEVLPDYTDFMYFSLTIAATSQTSDVAVSTRAMRRWVLTQSILAFAFNTSLLALAINIAAGLLQA